MRLADAKRLVFNGQEALRATLNGQVVWTPDTGVELLPGQYFTDFSEYAVGSMPSDWTRRLAANFDWSVDNSPSAIGGKIIRGFTEPSEDRNALSWDVIDSDPDRTDVKVLTRVRFPGGISQAEILVMSRGSGSVTSNTQNLYRHGARPTTSETSLGKYVNGSFSNLQSPSQAYVSDTWYLILTEVSGTNHRVKVWADTGDYADEPANWQAAIEDTSITEPGWVGLFRFRTGPIDVDFFSVGVGGVDPYYPPPMPV